MQYTCTDVLVYAGTYSSVYLVSKVGHCNGYIKFKLNDKSFRTKN